MYSTRKNLFIAPCPSGKVLTIQGKTWFDKVNGNSYFSATVKMCYRKKSYYFEIPFEYGYGDSYIDAAKRELLQVPGIKHLFDPKVTLPRHCRENKIHFTATMQRNCLKRDLIK